MLNSDRQKVRIVCGAQFGSEGKGNIAAWLASQDSDMVCVRVGGPNAGHTVISPKGIRYKFQHLPTGAIYGNTCVIAAGSEVDITILINEIRMLQQDGVEPRVLVDGMATVLTGEHSATEMAALPHGEGGITKRIGSTGKGVGAARSDRIWRRARVMNDPISSFVPPWETVDTLRFLHDQLSLGIDVLIEGTQGYGLGLHTRFYPYTTSGDCRAIDFLSQVGLCPWAFPGLEVEPWLAARTFPIRVAGNSGPLENEITWDEVGQSPELTTVTNKIRRVGRWDGSLVKEAIYANGGYECKLALMFIDYLFPDLANVTNLTKILERAGTYIYNLEEEIGLHVYAVGTGPNTIVQLRND
jgi:adenylosuccinate synthase